MKNRIIAITGVTCAGKDFLLNKANEPLGVLSLNLGTVISETLHADRDTMMHAIDPMEIEAAQFAAYRKVITMQPLAVTCHAIRPSGNEHVYNLAMERIFNPTAYVLVTAPASVIATRIHERNRCGERRSKELTSEEVDYIQQSTIIAMKRLAKKIDCPLIILDNTSQDLEENIIKLSSLLRQIK